MNNIKQAPFYPGVVSDKYQDEIRGSDFWPIILALHFNTGGKLFVAESEYSYDNIRRVYMRTKQGAHILGIKRSLDGEFSIHASFSNLLRSLTKPSYIFSNNTKYLINKLKQGEVIINQINKTIIQAENQLLPSIVTKLVQSFSKEVKESGAEIRVELRNSVAEYAVRALFQGSGLGVEAENVNELKEWYTKIQESDAKKARYNKKYADMFSPLKHLVINIRPDLYITGQVKAICRESDYEIKLETPQELTMTNDLTTQPELMASLAFWKILREARKEKVACLDSAGMLLNTTNFIDFEANSMVFGEVDNYVVYLVHKTGEQI